MDNGKLFGRSIAFPPRIGPDGRWQWSEGSQNIRESIEIILLTEPGERLMGPALLEQVWLAICLNQTRYLTRRLIQEDIQNSLRLWEPRINVQRVDVEADSNDEQRANITIVYRLVATGATQEISLSNCA